jgi:hypothetical protein
MNLVLPTVRMKRQHTYDPVGACIYCGKTGGPLTTEHIIPESFGGTLLLPAATYHPCAVETGAVEGRCAGQLFRPARRELRLPQKNKKAKAKLGVETFNATIDGVPVKLLQQDFPTLLVSFEFDPPGIIVRQPKTELFAGRIVINRLPTFAQRLGRLFAKHNVSEGISLGNQGDGTDLARMLAKIGHGYAVAEMGLGSFRPYLTDIILNRPPMHIGHYVGGLFGHMPKGDDLHLITLSDFWGRNLVVVEIQLFAEREMPVYVVVGGESFANG